MENSEPEINRIALELEYSGLVEPETISLIIEVHELVICDVAVKLGRPDLREQFAGKFAGLPDVMHAIKTLEDISPNISPNIAKRVQKLLGLDELI